MASLIRMLQDVPSDLPPDGRPFRDHHQVSPSLKPKQAGTRNRGRCEAGVLEELEPVVLSVDDEGGCSDGGDELLSDTGVSAQGPMKRLSNTLVNAQYGKSRE